MPPAPARFDLDDAKSFDENLSDFLQSLSTNNPELAATLTAELSRLLRREIQVTDVWDALEQALEPASPREGVATADDPGKRVFEGACVGCHSWTGVSAISPFATIAGTRAVNDPTATNVAQIVISGTARQTPKGVVSMPAFGSIFADAEIAAVANYVTARFGNAKSAVTESDIAALRNETAR